MRIYRLSQAEFRAWRGHETRAELTKRIFTQHDVAQIRAPNWVCLGLDVAAGSTSRLRLTAVQAGRARAAARRTKVQGLRPAPPR